MQETLDASDATIAAIVFSVVVIVWVPQNNWFVENVLSTDSIIWFIKI